MRQVVAVDELDQPRARRHWPVQPELRTSASHATIMQALGQVRGSLVRRVRGFNQRTLRTA